MKIIVLAELCIGRKGYSRNYGNAGLTNLSYLGGGKIDIIIEYNGDYIQA